MEPRTGRRKVCIHMVGTCRQHRNVYIMDVLIATPADILHVLFDHVEERVGSGINHITRVCYLLDMSSVMAIWMF